MDNRRRKFIQTVSAGAIAGLAGCSFGGDGGTETEQNTTNDGTETGDGGSGTETGDGESGTESGDEDLPEIITMEAGGADIWNSADLGHFYYAQVSGDFDVRVEVSSLENTNPHAKAGLMARASLEPPSRNIMVRRRAGFDVSPQWRPQDSASTTSTTSEQGAPLSRVEGGTFDGNWVRLERAGDTFRAYASQDGEEWTLMVELPSNVIELPDEVYVGLAATSHDQAEATTAKFRNFSGIELTDNGDIGNPLVPGSVSVAQPAIVELSEPDTSPNAATLTGTLTNMGGADSVDVRFEYQRAMDTEWQQTDATTLSETGEFGVDISDLTPRRYYRYRALVDNGETQVSTVSTLLSTPSGSSGSSDAGPDSASEFDAGDGFTDLAPWVDDDTPLAIVSEATRDELARATSIPGPRIVVFETSGTIDLGAEDLNVRNDRCWIAGQTAPSPGVTLTRGGLWLYGNDCAVQHIRVRPGIAGQDRGWQPDAIEIADDTENNVVDHCTGTWGIDENINVGYDTNNSTLSNNLVAEPLNAATHSKGEHGYNTIIGNRAKNVSLMGNVWALGTDRNPRLKQGTETVIVNNLIHHYSDGMWADPDTAHSIIGNVFEEPQTEQPNIFGEGTVYASDNVQNDGADVPMIGDAISTVSSRPLFPDELEPVATDQVKEHNLTNAGARPADRTEHDQRIVENIRTGGGGVIDSQEEVGGYPQLPENTESIDEPDSGVRAWLRQQAVDVEQ